MNRKYRLCAGYERPPVPPEETRHCVAYGADGKPCGAFDVPASYCLMMDAIGWRGYFWNMQAMAQYGARCFPDAASFAFEDTRPLSGIREA